MKRQRLNVIRMEMLGAKVVPALSRPAHAQGSRGRGARRVDRQIPIPSMCSVRRSARIPIPRWSVIFQAVIGCEAREQILAECGKLPVAAFACVGGGSNAIGLFAGFVDDADVRLIGVEPAGRGLTYGDHAASLCKGEPGVMHGFHSYMIKDENGEPGAVYSISAGLDYPSVGPTHSYLKDIGRAEYVSVTDKEAVDAFFLLSRTEGIIPALESSHALAQAVKVAPTLPKDAALLVCLSGRGDKDVEQMEAFLESAK